MTHNASVLWAAGLLVAAVLLGTATATTASAPPTERCLSKQHVNTIVNVRVALSQKTTVMDSCVTPTQQACVRDCCSKDLVPGFKCNMVVYRLNKPLGSDNCYLFHCEREEDCPLIAMEGANPFDHDTSHCYCYYLDFNHCYNFSHCHGDTDDCSHHCSHSGSGHYYAESHNRGCRRNKTTAKRTAPPAVTPAPPLGRVVDPKGVLKTSLAAAVVVGLVFLTLAVALLGRKALESFNRRHYTRLELNDLQYDV
ncbi:hypothetical protein AAFF_G00173350 [Aldrovandia affinis]|uniref:MANSC domain-containing protein n=1 Tax=Aldrovandia affinis TaxID=143900 RepID=A0AAD7WWY6_9TELE|nr:hypothetical protein AAFF_G00173350 [Aldrovandia affinis]